jgi:putative ABC transport system permease protein
MRWLRAFLVRLGGCVRRTRREQALKDEIDSHLQLHVDDNIRAGMSLAEARRDAVLKLGGIEPVKEAMRDRQRLPWLEHLAQDVRFAFRSLRKSPGFTTVAVLTLALCIGANSAVFSIVHAILLKPYPWPESDRLVQIYNTQPLIGTERRGVSVPTYIEWRNGITALEDIALITWSPSPQLNVAATDIVSESVTGVSVTPSLFSVLKIYPSRGRTFSENDARVGAPKTVVISDALWRNQLGGDPNIIGTQIRLSGEIHTVIGVMPRGFYFPTPEHQLWLPFAFTPWQKSDAARNADWGPVIARLKPGATLDLVQREITALQKVSAERLSQFKAEWEASGYNGTVLGFLEAEVGKTRTTLWLVQVAVAVVLLIGCANVASLLLARAGARERELAVRAALGAGRNRLVRHLLTEGLLLFVAGGLIGMLIAAWSLTAVNQIGLATFPRSWNVSLDFAVLGLTLGCALATGLAFSALPAWSATRDDNALALKDAGERATASRRHLSLRSALVVSEVALALMLVATAALLIKSLHRVGQVRPGFDPENVLVGRFSLPQRKYASAKKLSEFQNRLIERVRALPGVTSAACANRLPFVNSSEGGDAFAVDGRIPAAGQPAPHAAIRWVSPGFFATLGIPLIRGRVFTEQDTLSTTDVVVIDKTLAERQWPGENPIGKRLIWGFRPNAKSVDPRPWEVIGVVGPVRQASLETATPGDSIYFSTMQAVGGDIRLSGVVIKTTCPPAQLAAALRAAVLAVDPELPLSYVGTMDGRIQRSMERRRTPMTLLTLFAGISLLLGALGIYGVLAFAVGQRTKEIGVRMALGASGAKIVGMVLRQTVRLVAIGAAIGLGGYFGLSTLIRKMLFSVETTDYAALLIAPATLALVALAACLIPARRATKVDPIVALRAE